MYGFLNMCSYISWFLFVVFLILLIAFLISSCCLLGEIFCDNWEIYIFLLFYLYIMRFIYCVKSKMYRNSIVFTEFNYFKRGILYIWDSFVEYFKIIDIYYQSAHIFIFCFSLFLLFYTYPTYLFGICW